ncbi:MAG: flippase-like domain-containing protein [Candidatus Bathyarchaeota archaeon]|jgi:uncharacterized protein (TIRG00374 family)
MEIERSSALRKGIPLLLLGLFVFLLYVYFFVGFADIMDTFLLADPVYYSLAFATFLLSTTFYSMTWWRLLHILSVKTNFRKPFLFTWVGAFVDLLIPAESVSGEVSRAYLMHRDSNEDSGKIVASVVSHRILTTTTNLCGMIGASALFIIRYEPPGLVVGFLLVIAICTTLSLFLLIYLCTREKATTRLVNWLIRLLKRIFKTRLKGTRLASTAKRMLREFHKGIDTFGKHPRKLVLPIVFSIMAWLFDILIGFFVFSSLHVSVPFSTIVIVYSISMVVQTIPIGIPGDIGLVEIVMTSLYTLLLQGVPGITLTIIAVATLLTRALTLWAKLIISGLVVQWVGIKMLRGSPS